VSITEAVEPDRDQHDNHPSLPVRRHLDPAHRRHRRIMCPVRHAQALRGRQEDRGLLGRKHPQLLRPQQGVNKTDESQSDYCGGCDAVGVVIVKPRLPRYAHRS